VGVGWASVNVRSSTQITNRVTTKTNTSLPSAAMAPTSGYKTNAALPSGASGSTYSRIKGLSGGIWQATANGANGDGTDNAELDNRVTIVAADCASLTFDSAITQTQEEICTNGGSGTIIVNAEATGGTGLWLRGFEFDGSMADIPPDDPDTVQNESIEYVKSHGGVFLFETLILGPFEYGGSNSCPLIIPFTLKSCNLENLYFAADGETKSTPLQINCPTGIVVRCTDPVPYPTVSYSGCGSISVTFDPPFPAGGVYPAGTFPVGLTPVKVTATDSGGDSTNCTFTITVTDTNAPVPPVIPDAIGQCSVTVTPPIASDDCAGNVTGTTSSPLTYSAQGTNFITWTFDDGHGNTSTAVQRVIVRDVTPPVRPTLPDIYFNGCGTSGYTPATPPTTTDNCKGIVTGTTTNSFPITAIGTNVVTWTFDDGNGNKTTATQKVIISGLTFVGFYSPINGTNGTCSSPLRTINQGSVNPIKFDIYCGTTLITGGTPPVVMIQAYTNNCTAGAELVVTNAVYQNDWHFNWDTTGWAKGVYKATVVLPDGTQPYVFVRVK
jgi:hypothetical protein